MNLTRTFIIIDNESNNKLPSNITHVDISFRFWGICGWDNGFGFLKYIINNDTNTIQNGWQRLYNDFISINISDIPPLQICNNTSQYIYGSLSIDLDLGLSNPTYLQCFVCCVFYFNFFVGLESV